MTSIKNKNSINSKKIQKRVKYTGSLRAYFDKKRREYNQHLGKFYNLIPCKFCPSHQLAPIEYTSHIEKKHQNKIKEFLSKFRSYQPSKHLNCRQMCVWCFNKFWSKDSMRDNYDHKIECFNSYYLHYQIIDPELNKIIKTVPKDLLSLYLCCPLCDEWYHSCKNNVAPPDIPPNLLSAVPYNLNWTHYSPASISKLQMDISSGILGIWMQTFHYNTDHNWFHTAIYYDDWDNFCVFAKMHQETMLVFPYWCLCNGGYPTDIARHHRHIIICINHLLVDAIIDALKSIQFTHNLQFFRISNQLDFISLWYYVSSEQFICFEQQSTPKLEHNCHFYVFRPLNPHCYLGMALYIKDGFKIITETSKNSLAYDKVFIYENKNYLYYTDIFKNLQFHLFPVEKTVNLNSETKDHLYLIGNTEKYFSLSYNPLNDDSFPLDINDRIKINLSHLKKGNFVKYVLGDEKVFLPWLDNYLLQEKDYIIQQKDDEIISKDKKLLKNDETINELTSQIQFLNNQIEVLNSRMQSINDLLRFDEETLNNIFNVENIEEINLIEN